MMEITQSYANYESMQESQICRICLEPTIYSRIHYCECRGNMHSLHDQCLIEWAKRTQKYHDEKKAIFIFCDVCKSRIYLKIELICSTRSAQGVCKAMKDMLCQTIMMLFLLVLFGTVSIVSVVQFINGVLNQLLFWVVMIVSGLVFFLSLVLLFGKLLIKWKYEIVGFRPIAEMVTSKSVANSFGNSFA